MTKRTFFYIFILTLCLGKSARELQAQSTQPAPSSEGLKIRLTPYLWGPDFKGTLGIGDRSTHVDASFRDLIRELNFALMGVFEANRNRFTTVTDIVYMNLSDERATPGPLFSSANAVAKSFILSPEAGYRVVGSDASFLDVLGGIRFWRVDGKLELKPGFLDSVNLSRDRNWVDGIFGLRGRRRLSPTWYLSGYGDIGGGGSNLTYQLVGTAGKDLSNRYALVFGYRYLNVNYDKDRFLYDVGMGGPIFGFAVKF